MPVFSFFAKWCLLALWLKLQTLAACAPRQPGHLFVQSCEIKFWYVLQT